METYAERMKERMYELHINDIIYCNTAFIEELGYDYDLIPGEAIYIFQIKEERSIDKVAKVIKVFTEKKYPNKKWWQFWLKQEEKVTGYHIIIV